VKASASQALAATYHAVSAAIVDNPDGCAEIRRKGLQAADTLTEGERVRFFAFEISVKRWPSGGFVVTMRTRQNDLGS